MVANPRRSAGATVGGYGLRLFRWTTSPRGPHHAEHVVRIFTSALDIGSHINAPVERRPTGREPRMSTEPALWAVRSTERLGVGWAMTPVDTFWGLC